MSTPTRHIAYQPGKRCSVVGCDAPAELEVYLYDYYPYEEHEFFEQDFTCPFICTAHMEKNEREAVGQRMPRGLVFYPYTNRGRGQGYTKYTPLSDVFPLLYKATNIAHGRLIISSIEQINEELITYLARHPELIYEINPRRFEELVAELLKHQGFDPTLTPKTRDGGKDIIARKSDALGEHLYLVECKRYAPSRKVGVEQVRSIHGVARAEGANKGILVTTSSFTSAAVDFAAPLKYDLMLADFEILKSWVNKAANTYTV